MGARTIKTGLAVAISAAICHIFDLPIIFAALSAVVNLKPSVIQSWKNALEQIYVNLLGVVIAFVVGLTIGSNPLTIGLTTMLVIWLCGALGWADASVMGILAALFVLTAAPEQFVDHALDRSAAIFIGLAIASLTNYYVLPPRYGARLRASLAQLGQENAKYFLLVVEHYTDIRPPDQDQTTTLKQSIVQLQLTAQDLLSRYQEQVGRAKPRGITPSRNPDMLSEFLVYQKDFYHRTLYLEGLIEERLARRKQTGNQPVSVEFQQVLAHIDRGAQRVIHLNQDLQKAILEDAQINVIPVIHNYWDDLDDTIDMWKSKFSGIYYLHALVEIGFIIGEIKWATSQARELFKKLEEL